MFPAVIPVAGVGTRSLPASKVVPKELLPVFDRPIIQHIVEEVVASKCSQVIFVSSKGKSLIEDHFDRQPDLEAFLEKKGKKDVLQIVQNLSQLVKVSSVRQKEALGLGHAIGMAEGMISSSHFFVLLGDEMTIASPTACQQMLQVWKEETNSNPNAGIVILMKVPDADVSKYGICEVKGEKINRCVEKPKPSETSSRWAITGRYLLPLSTFEKIRATRPSQNGEIQLTDALHALAEEGNLFPCFFEGERFDAGDRLGFLKANLHFYLNSSYRDELIPYLKEILK
jgi:UTP--glucose-1-phosphate uridylyltransferase